MLPGGPSSNLDELRARVDALERRLSALEQSLPALAPYPEPTASPTAVPGAPGEPLSAQPQSNVFSVFGIAVLGIAGAYILRAASETRTIPQAIAVALALAYGAGWLVWAAWSRAISRFARYAYAVTSALILSPLLWEATVRFGILAPPWTAAILAAFALLAFVLAWRSHLAPILWIAMLTVIVTAFLLMVAARDPVSFTSAILFAALLTESAACWNRWGALRYVVGPAADVAILIVVAILGDSRAVPQDYHPANFALLIALAVGLFAVYAASMAFRSLVRQNKVAIFEISQFPLVVLLAGWAVLRVTQGTGQFALGIFCLLAGAASYFAAFALVARRTERRTFRFFALWAVVFVLTGSFLAVPDSPLVIWLCLAAVAASALGLRARSPALDLHGVAYLAAAVVASGLLLYAARALAGTYPPAPGALPIFAALTAFLCAVIVSRYPGEHRAERFLRLMPAVFAVISLAALAVAMLVWLVSHGVPPALPQLAVVRTVVTCVAAVVLAFVGARRDRIELVWMAYAAAVLGSLKLAVEDFRIGSTESLAVSLFIYGVVLILIPRLVRAGRHPARGTITQ